MPIVFLFVILQTLQHFNKFNVLEVRSRASKGTNTHVRSSDKTVLMAYQNPMITSGNKRVLFFTGAKGRTDYLKLDKWFHNDFEAGSKEQYTVEGFDVGNIQLIELHSDGGGYWSGDPDWFVNRVKNNI